MSSFQGLKQPIPQISVEQLASLLAAGKENLQLVDVREPQEVAIARLKGFENLPLSEFGKWSGEIQNRFDPHAETIVLCHHGVRSAQMCQWLIVEGFTNVKNVTGGIDAYSAVVDSTIPRY
ncbi:rhodanese-like domain-containing protein [Aerosakkonema funiforme]|uniref:rhodanese-like domain-containing protein n=1 Tax=Oscillatoriophycideae TaxID=1301283 RepID=UPI002AC817EA|nr:rhodanese-like domain-containing protein [Aerosakkonema funiforme]